MEEEYIYNFYCSTLIAFVVGRMPSYYGLESRLYGITLIQWMNVWILRCVSGIPSRFFFAGADDITKEKEPGIEIIERTPQSLIITTAVVYLFKKKRVNEEVTIQHTLHKFYINYTLWYSRLQFSSQS